MKTLQSPGKEADGPLADQASTMGPWFHNLHLPDGTETAPDHPLGDFPRRVWREFADLLPDDLSGKQVLDLGCNAGFYAFELAERGAEVLAIDNDGHYLEQARWAADYLDPEGRVTFENRHVYRLHELDELFDLVLMLGLFYHLRYPLLGLDIVASMADDWMVFQSLSVPGDESLENRDRLEFDQRRRMREPGWPKVAFIKGKLAGDPTNWWVPNREGCRALLEDTGFRIEAEPDDEIFLCRRNHDREPPIERYSSELRAAIGRYDEE